MIKKPSKCPKFGQGFIIQDWMIRCFHLQGDALLIYAYIHSFSKDGEGKYYGSLSQLSYWCGRSRPTVMKVLNSLLEKGLILKEEVPYTGLNKARHYCRYWTTFSRLSETEQEKILSTTV